MARPSLDKIGEMFDRQVAAITPRLGARRAQAIAAAHIHQKYPGALQALKRRAKRDRAAGRRQNPCGCSGRMANPNGLVGRIIRRNPAPSWTWLRVDIVGVWR